MIINKDNTGKPLGLIETLVSNEHVVNINQTQQVTTVITRDRKLWLAKTLQQPGSRFRNNVTCPCVSR
jgi:hypothetical protein